ncbi:MAG: 30S ribosomal protein S12 methylthiotransferase RimO [Lachnospiraceae bacterium]|nr:30S ribosomal protein S12 methylthiotransferase RimO [Lachnospiraceae bacterium]
MKILFISLGCDKNLVDTEVMLGFLTDAGYSLTDDENEADIAIVNTCSFILDAKEESINTILEMAELKKTGSLKVLLVCGCLAQRYAGDLKEEIPEIDGILGTMALPEIVDAVNEALNGKQPVVLPDINRELPTYDKRIVTSGGYSANLKIAEGCNKRCTYCAIPSMRGSYRSFPMEHLIKEAEYLVNEVGVKELILVAQETTLYGVDIYGKKSLPVLLEKLSEIEELRWIRILYCYPEEIDEELIRTIAGLPKVCHYLDVPIQHASDDVLKRMGRRTNNAELREKIAMIRKIIPDICLRTTLITGFPGETEEDFITLYNFVDEMEFDRLGVFAYSKEEGTPAALMENQIPDSVKEQRKDELLMLQQEIAFEKAEEKVGSSFDVIVEGKLTGEDTYVTRTYMDAPDVDGYLFLHTTAELESGDIVRANVTGCNEYDLIGVLSDECSE